MIRDKLANKRIDFRSEGGGGALFLPVHCPSVRLMAQRQHPAQPVCVCDCPVIRSSSTSTRSFRLPCVRNVPQIDGRREREANQAAYNIAQREREMLPMTEVRDSSMIGM